MINETYLMQRLFEFATMLAECIHLIYVYSHEMNPTSSNADRFHHSLQVAFQDYSSFMSEFIEQNWKKE